MSGYTGLGQREGVQSVALNAWAKMTHNLLPERLEFLLVYLELRHSTILL